MLLALVSLTEEAASELCSVSLQHTSEHLKSEATDEEATSEEVRHCSSEEAMMGEWRCVVWCAGRLPFPAPPPSPAPPPFRLRSLAAPGIWMKLGIESRSCTALEIKKRKEKRGCKKQ